jgi:hypothetical protein
VRLAHQEVGGKGEAGGGRLVARKQHRYLLVTQLDVGIAQPPSSRAQQR